MATKAITVQGSTLELSTVEVTDVNVTPLPDMESLDCLEKQVQYQDGSTTENDVTTICSTAKEFLLGLTDSGSMSLTGFYNIGDPGHAALKAAKDDKLLRLVIFTFVDGSKFKGTAYVTQRSWSAAVDGVVEATANLRFSGPTVEVEAP